MPDFFEHSGEVSEYLLTSNKLITPYTSMLLQGYSYLAFSVNTAVF